MPSDLAARIEHWLSQGTDIADPGPAMQQAGLFDPADSYTRIARLKAAIVQRTGLLGLAGLWAGRQLVGRHFIAGFGNAAQRDAWMGRAVSVAISEPGAGAHPKRLTTKAEPHADGFRINGEKAWVTNGPSADAFVILAITAVQGDRKRYSAFLVPRDTQGVSLKEMPRFHALRPSRHCGLLLHDVLVPHTTLLGAPDTAYETMALPFRDIEDAVGTFGLLGAIRFLLGRTGTDQQSALTRGGLVSLAAVFQDAAEALLAALDAGRLADKAATLVGLRVLTTDMVQRIRTDLDQQAQARDPAVEEVLRDLDTSLSVARGPREIRQARLGAV